MKRLAALGAVLAGGLAALEQPTPGTVAAVAFTGAAVAFVPSQPRAAHGTALAALAVAAPFGSGVSAGIAASAHVFLAARRLATVPGAAWSVAFLVAVLAGVRDAFFPQIAVIGLAWGIGHTLHANDLVDEQLRRRNRELEDERELHTLLAARFERARIASELHDVVGHALSVMVVQAAAGRASPAYADESLHAIATAARQAESDVDQLVALLSADAPAAVAGDLTLLDELVTRARAGGARIQFECYGDLHRVGSAASAIAYRVVQEGLTNVLRHAPGADIAVRVAVAPATLTVTIDNDRPPGTHDTIQGSRQGLIGLRERIAEVDGTLEAAALPGGGWRLTATLHLN